MRFNKMLFPLLILLPMSVSAGSVRSMSGEQQVQGPDGVSYLESQINCAGSNVPKVIWRKESGGDWCGKDVPGYCAGSKINAGKKVCGRTYDSALEALPVAGAAVEATPAAQPAAVPVQQPVTTDVQNAATTEAVDNATVTPGAQQQVAPAQQPVVENGQDLNKDQQKLEIERERLKIEQQRLELRKQQVELQKQELEIQQQLDTQKETAVTAPASQPAPQAAQPASTDNAPKKSVLGM